MKLNLGCGGMVLDGWVNIDLYSNVPGVTKLDVEHLPFQPGSIDEILAQDVLEHISHRSCERVLADWCALLKPGGIITIRCPDLEMQCRCLLGGTWDSKVLVYMMFGGQDHDGNYHKSGWTRNSLVEFLESHGLKVVSAQKVYGTLTSDIRTSDNPNILVVARRPSENDT